jgi:hypothetical protein
MTTNSLSAVVEFGEAKIGVVDRGYGSFLISLQLNPKPEVRPVEMAGAWESRLMDCRHDWRRRMMLASQS